MGRCLRRQSALLGLCSTQKTEPLTLRCTENLHTSVLLFDCVIGILNQWAETVPAKSDGKVKEQKHIRGAFKTCGYPNWTFVITTKISRADREEEKEKKV